MSEDRTHVEDRLVALHEAGHVVTAAAVGSTPDGVTIEPDSRDERSSQGVTAGTDVAVMDTDAHLLVVTAGAAAESIWGPDPRESLREFLDTPSGQGCRAEIRTAFEHLQRPTEPFEDQTFPPICSDRGEALSVLDAAFSLTRGMLEELEDLTLTVAYRLQEERTLGGRDIRALLPDDLWQEPGARVQKELHDKRKRLALDAA